MALAFEVACDPRVTCYRLRKFTGGEGWGSSIDAQEHREGSSPFFFDYKGRRIWFLYTRADSEPTYRVLPARPHEPQWRPASTGAGTQLSSATWTTLHSPLT